MVRRAWLSVIPIVVAFGSHAMAQSAMQPRELTVTTGKSLIVDSPVPVQRVSVANGEIAEAVAATPREIVINGKSQGETTVIVWQQGGNRLLFDLTVQPTVTHIDAVRRQLERELPSQNVTMDVEGENVFLRGSVKNLVSANRAVAIASTVGKPVNLLQVTVPPADTQVLLRVRFANVDRAATSELGANIISTGALNTPGRITTGQFSPPGLESSTGNQTTFSIKDALEIFLFRPDLNLGATIHALQNRRLLEILAEPNVLAIDGQPAAFLAGGEFPYPILQGGGAGLGAVTIQFREFGVRLGFLPRITPRGTIRLEVAPEVSALDYANGLVFQGFTIPGLSTRRVKTEIELEDRQSFVIGGLLDNRVTETLSKIPGLGDIPLLGKLFQSKSVVKNHSELLVLVTVEVVRPIPSDQAAPQIEMPRDFIEGVSQAAPRTPSVEKTGAAPARPAGETMPMEQLIESQKALSKDRPTATPSPVYQFVPVPVMNAPSPAAPPSAQTPPPAAQAK